MAANLSQESRVKRRTSNIFRHQKERAKKVGASLNYTIEALRNLARDALNQPCPYCAGAVEASNFSFDHAEPVTRHGGYELENLVCCCDRCNQIKGPLTASEFSDLMTFVNQLEPQAQQNIVSRLRAGAKMIFS